MAVSVANESLGVASLCEVPASPCIVIIFGAAGDLTKRKLIPALYNLRLHKQLPEDFAVVGLARADKNDDAFRQELATAMQDYAAAQMDEEQWHWFEERTYYLQGNFENPESYKRLSDLLLSMDKKHGTQGNYLFYLATSEDYFETIIEQISKVELHKCNEDQWRHFIIEKPFGRDLESAHKLNKKLLSILKENQIFRIDHYLGKETVQNILVFRFGNGIFEQAWNNHYIDHVQITVAETVGVESRGGFYEKAGALRDMIPNHLFQLLSFIAMEPPITFEADAVRSKKAEVINAIRPLTHEDVDLNVVRGQYGAGEVDDQAVQAYRTENRVAPDSSVETFVAMKLMIDNWRWVGVPFYLRTGKRMPKRTTEISIQFKSPPLCLFRNTTVSELVPNFLIMHIQPHEGISLQFGAKTPGALLQIGRVQMDFDYQDYFGPSPSTGYETLIYDCMMGDQTLFQRDDNVEAGWRVVEPIQQVWSSETPTDFPNYNSGSWGPQSAHQLLIRDGRQWRI
jgi:glucose-6-phosphate 1-dehydrogenase